MCRSREDEFRKSKLLDAPEPLKLGRVEQRPGKLCEGIVFSKYNQSVHRIPNALGLRHVQNLS